MQLTERETTLLNVPNQNPCDETSNEMETSERTGRFQNCCKDVLWSDVLTKINCTIPGFEELLGESPNFENCSDYSTAANSHGQLRDAMRQYASICFNASMRQYVSNMKSGFCIC